MSPEQYSDFKTCQEQADISRRAAESMEAKIDLYRERLLDVLRRLDDDPRKARDLCDDDLSLLMLPAIAWYGKELARGFETASQKMDVGTLN